MQRIQSESVSNFRNNYNVVLQKMSDGPVYLLQHSNLVGVLISPEAWNALVDRVEDLEDIAAAWKHKYERASGQSAPVPFNLAEFVEDEEPELVPSGD